ncbi:hypothetical protein JCM15415_18890 [Methanobacterium movens]
MERLCPGPLAIKPQRTKFQYHPGCGVGGVALPLKLRHGSGRTTIWHGHILIYRGSYNHELNVHLIYLDIL